MSTEKNLDYETLCKSRTERFCDWRLGIAHDFRDWRKDVTGRFTQRGWLETEAEVTSCSSIPQHYSRFGATTNLSGWAVGFAYVVSGKTYDGILMSRDKLEKHDRFAIRYNPDQPAENDSLETKLGWIDGFVVGAYDLFLALILVSLVVWGIFLNR